MRALWPIALVLTLALPALAGTADNPELTDGAEETPAASMDIQKGWITANATHTQVNLQIAELPEVPDGAALGVCADPGCAGLSLSYRVEFVVRDSDGAPASDITDYAATYLIYRHGAPDGLRAVIGYRVEGVTAVTFNGPVEVTVAGTVITFHVERGRGEMFVPVGDKPGAYSITDFIAYDSPQFCDSGLPADVPACQSVVVIPPDPAAPDKIEWDHAPDSGTSIPFVFEADNVTVDPTTTTSSSSTTDPSVSTSSGSTSGSSSGDPSNTGSSEATRSNSTESTQDDSKGSPSPLWLVIVAVAVGVAVRRRAP